MRCYNSTANKDFYKDERMVRKMSFKNSDSRILDKKAFLMLALSLALPIMLQNLISTLVNSADTLMLGYVSQSAMSASSLANGFVFVLFCVYFGISTGTSVLCGQYYGKDDKETIERVMGLAFRITILISLLFFAICFFAPETIMRLFSDSKETIEAGKNYLRVVSFSFVFMGISQVYVSALRSVGKVIFPSLLYILSLVVNVVFNALFIFGFCGFPKLGVVGVALGTVIARVFEVILCIIHSVFISSVKFRVKYLFSKTGVLLGDFVKISVPSLLNDLIWGLAASAFSAILGHLGDDVVAANSVAVMVVDIGAIASRGFANATTIIVSQNLGENKMEATKVYSGRMLRITTYVALLGCAVMMILRKPVMAFYSDKLTETAVRYLGIMMIMTTWRLVGEGVNTCMVCGCFRGGGDSKFGMKMDLVYMWLVAVPLMFIAAFVLKLPAMWVYLVMTLDEYYKMPTIVMHYKKMKWMKNITREKDELALTEKQA